MLKKGAVLVIILAFITVFGFANNTFGAAAAGTGAAKAAGAAAGTATTAGVSAGTIAALAVGAAAIAAIAVAAGGEGGAAVITPTPAPTPSEAVDNFLQSVDQDTEQSFSQLALVLNDEQVSLLSEVVQDMSWDEWQDFVNALAQIQDVSELQGLVATQALEEFLNEVKTKNPDLYSKIVEFLKGLKTNDQLNRVVEFAKSIENEDEFNSTKNFMAQIDKDTYKEIIEAYLTTLHQGYTVTFTHVHVGGGEYVTVVHLTPKH